MRRLALLLIPVVLAAGCGAPATNRTNRQEIGVAAGIRVLVDVSAAVVPDYRLGQGLPTWSPDGRRLIYTGPSPSPGGRGPAMLLDLATPKQPRPVTTLPAFDPAWSPDGKAITFVSERNDAQGPVSTIFSQRLDDRDAVDLLPGNQAVQGVKSVGYIHRWLDEQTLAYDAFVGTGNMELFLLDVAKRKRHRIPATPSLIANHFTWTAAGDRVAGQRYGDSGFGVWDLRQSRYLGPTEPYPGQEQFFEAWSSDGREALFTAWEGGVPYWGPKARSLALYRLDVDHGRFTKVAEETGLAAWSGEIIAYIKLRPKLTLIVTNARDGRVLWTDDLGEVPPEFRYRALSYRPIVAGPYLAYRTASSEWRVSPVNRKEPRTIYLGEEVSFSWRPDGRYVALMEHGTPARLSVVENPLLGR